MVVTKPLPRVGMRTGWGDRHKVPRRASDIKWMVCKCSLFPFPLPSVAVGPSLSIMLVFSRIPVTICNHICGLNKFFLSVCYFLPCSQVCKLHKGRDRMHRGHCHFLNARWGSWHKREVEAAVVTIIIVRATIHWALAMCQACFTCFTHINSFKCRNKPFEWILIQYPFCRWRNWGVREIKRFNTAG